MYEKKTANQNGLVVFEVCPVRAIDWHKKRCLIGNASNGQWTQLENVHITDVIVLNSVLEPLLHHVKKQPIHAWESLFICRLI